MINAATGSARREWCKGWTLALTSAAAMSMGPLHLYTQSVFVEPLEAEFGSGRAQGPSLTGYVYDISGDCL